MKRVILSAFAFVILLGAANTAFAHCEIPCGIYHDSLRIEMLREDITTMEKAMNQIKELQAADNINYNQLVRWITNKDEHAEKFQHTVWQYFMTQRIKPVEAGADGYADYQKKVETLHQMLVYAMKCMQTTDQANIDKLRTLVNDFAAMYFTGHDH
jgi:nickel superoxide dismutase